MKEEVLPVLSQDAPVMDFKTYSAIEALKSNLTLDALF